MRKCNWELLSPSDTHSQSRDAKCKMRNANWEILLPPTRDAWSNKLIKSRSFRAAKTAHNVPGDRYRYWFHRLYWPIMIMAGERLSTISYVVRYICSYVFEQIEIQIKIENTLCRLTSLAGMYSIFSYSISEQ